MIDYKKLLNSPMRSDDYHPFLEIDEDFFRFRSNHPEFEYGLTRFGFDYRHIYIGDYLISVDEPKDGHCWIRVVHRKTYRKWDFYTDFTNFTDALASACQIALLNIHLVES